jgi:hypothetical protein
VGSGEEVKEEEGGKGREEGDGELGDVGKWKGGSDHGTRRGGRETGKWRREKEGKGRWEGLRGRGGTGN